MPSLNGNIEEIFLSSEDEPYDSDRIDSDVEAELYSVIHHHQETPRTVNEESLPTPNDNDCKEISMVDSDNNKHEISGNSNINLVNNSFCDKLWGSNLYQSFESPIVNKLNENKREDLTANGPTIIKLFHPNSSRQETLNLPPTNELNNMKNKTIRIDSSDEDSDIIWTSPEDSTQSMQVNFSQNCIDIDSDSNDSWSFRLSNAGNISANTKIKDPWHVNSQDLHRSRRSSGRYHESNVLNCSNCNMRGHIAKFCTSLEMRKCYFCGAMHRPHNCKNRVCVRCGRIGHDYKWCKSMIYVCGHCGFLGHPTEYCPDMWRKFQLTTSRKFIRSRKLVQDTPIYCYNCGQRGHFGGGCKSLQNRIDRGLLVTWPSVIEIGSPKKKIKLKKQIQRNITEDSKKKPVKNIKKNIQRQLKIVKRKMADDSATFVDKFIAEKEMDQLKKLELRRQRRQEKKRLKEIKRKSELAKEKANTENKNYNQQMSFQKTPRSQNFQDHNAASTSRISPAENKQHIELQITPINKGVSKARKRKIRKQRSEQLKNETGNTSVMSPVEARQHAASKKILLTGKLTKAMKRKIKKQNNQQNGVQSSNLINCS